MVICDLSHLQNAHPSFSLVWRSRIPLAERAFVVQQRPLECAKPFFFRNFERILVLLLVASLLIIYQLIEQKFAFLNFYYLPIILAGFYGGPRFAVVAGLFIAFFFLLLRAPPRFGLFPGLTLDAGL